MVNRNPFIDVIEAPDLATKIVAKDGSDDAGYVTIDDLFGVVGLPAPTETWSALGGASLDLHRGFWTTTSPSGANIWRFADRVFIGEAASNFAGDVAGPDGGTSWFNRSDYPGYLGINAHLLVTSSPGGSPDVGPYGIVSAFRCSDTESQAIAYGAVVVGDTADSGWGGIAELQREHDDALMVGWECVAKNKAADRTMTPHSLTSGIFGLWLVAGGDSTFGGAPTNPSTAAIAVVSNSGQTWNDGIIFSGTALTSGRAITMSSEGVGGAHQLNWHDVSDDTVFTIQSFSTGPLNWHINSDNIGIYLGTASGEALTIASVADSVNGFSIFCHTAGNSPVLSAVGSDTNIDINLAPKGTGAVRTPSPVVGGAVSISVAAGATAQLDFVDGGAQKWLFSKHTDNSLFLWNIAAGGMLLQFGAGATRTMGFFGATPVAKPTGVAVTAAGIHAALVSLGLIAA